MKQYALYLDDSGTKDYSAAGYGSGATRYFVFGGVLATQDAASVLAQKLKDLKRLHLSRDDVEMKSNWLRMPHERIGHYLDPLGISESDLTKTVDAIYDTVIQAEVELLACVVDKVHMEEAYGERAYYPPAVAYEAVIQRVQNRLAGVGLSQVFIDDMTGKNPKGNEHKLNLIRHHSKLRKFGSRMLRPTMNIDVLGDLRFQSSARSELIQVADLVAYNVYRQFVEHGEDWERLAPTLPTYTYFDRLGVKFRRGPGNRVQGYGIVKVPMKRRVPWEVH